MLGAAEHLPAADYPSDPRFSGTHVPSPCLNVTLVMPGRIITRSLRKASVFDLGLRRGHSQVAFIVINEFFIFFFPPRCSPACNEKTHGLTLLISRKRSVTVEL